jgi:hypothetical protein
MKVDARAVIDGREENSPFWTGWLPPGHTLEKRVQLLKNQRRDARTKAAALIARHAHSAPRDLRRATGEVLP